jgi:hypothetical protein
MFFGEPNQVSFLCSEVAIEGITQGQGKMGHISVKARELIMAETCERIISRYSFLVGTCTFVYNLFVRFCP